MHLGVWPVTPTAMSKVHTLMTTQRLQAFVCEVSQSGFCQCSSDGGDGLGQVFIHLTGVLVMKHVISEFKHFALDESGATAIEYGLLAALVALGITVGATALGTELGLFFGRIATRLSTAV